MEQGKIAAKSKAKKDIVTKVSLSTPEKIEVPTLIDEYGLKLTLDNSLKRFANDPFIIEHNERVNRKFAKHKSE